MQIVMLGMLLAIVVSLGHALSSMSSGPGSSQKMVRALTTRVSLSVALFVLILVAAHFGWIEPHGTH